MHSNPWEWDESDLLELVSLGVQESLELDYKRCDALQRTESKKNEVSKDVSAFANSAGGTIVYGMREDGHVPTAIDDGFDPNEISKEWIEQVINSRIQRRISDIRVNQIQLAESAPGRVAYAIVIPQSQHAPHQASDKRFYKRFNFESVPMEEYEIRDVSNRATSPDLLIRFAFRPGENEVDLVPKNEEFYKPIELCAVVTNESSMVANHAVFDIYLDSRIQVEQLPDDIRRLEIPSSIKMEGVDRSMTRLVTLWDNKKGMPIFAGVQVEIPTPPLKIWLPRSTSLLALRYTIGSPGMDTRNEYRFISIKDDVAKIITPKVSWVTDEERAA